MSRPTGDSPPRMRGATASVAGSRGIVPKPTAGQHNFMLLGDGTWGAQPVAGLPSQTSNSGKLLTTDGTNASWTTTGVLTSLTSPAATPLTLGTGSFGTALTVASATGDVTISSTTAGSSGAGALVVAGGLSAAGASYFGGAVTVGGNLTLSTDGSKFLSAAGTTYFTPASGNTEQTVRIAPLGTATNAYLYIFGQASAAVGARFEFVQSGQNSTIRNQPLGGGAQGTFEIDNGGTALTISATKNATFGGAVTVSGAQINIQSGGATDTLRQGNAIVVERTSASGNVSLAPASSATSIGGAVTTGAAITTSAPTGGAGAWELGIANTVSPTSPNRTITIEIGGTVYYLAAKTTND